MVIESNEAVTVDDLRRALLDFRPTVVHFPGMALVLAASPSKMTPVTPTRHGLPLTKLFHHFKESTSSALY